MGTQIDVLLYTYGTFLILCGIVSVIFIGLKAKTALMSGGMAGSISILVGYLISTNTPYANFTGVLVTSALFCVFAWRSTKTLFTIFQLIPNHSPDLKGKGIAFLVISLMAVVSVFTTFLQILYFVNN
jgi:hypothetical protein